MTLRRKNDEGNIVTISKPQFESMQARIGALEKALAQLIQRTSAN
jgi:hypothetical protein